MSKPIQGEESFARRLTDYSLLAYAFQYWGVHVRNARTDAAVSHYGTQLVTDADRVAAYVQAAWYTSIDNEKSWDVRKDVDDLYVCAFYGLSSIIPTLQQKEHFNVDVVEKTYGQTPLMYVCRKGNVDVVNQLIGLGADVNIVSDKKDTALFEAVRNNQVGVVEVLVLRPELDINARQSRKSDCTAFMLAAELGHAEVVDRLLTRSDVGKILQDALGFTALHLASREGNFAVVTVLLQVPEVRQHIETTEIAVGWSALMSAAKNGHPGIVRLLLEHGANPE